MTLLADDSTRVFIDNPVLTVSGDRIAAIGEKGLLFRDLDQPGVSVAPSRVAIGATFRVDDEFVAPVASPWSGYLLSPYPLAVLHNDGSIDAVWREVSVRGADTTDMLKSGRWSNAWRLRLPFAHHPSQSCADVS